MTTVRLPPDVVDDLIALVRADAASDATVQLVTELAKSDPALSRRLRSETEPDIEPWPRTSVDVDLEQLKAAKRRANLRSTLMGFAWFSSLSIFSFAVGDAGFRWLVLGTPLTYVAAITAVVLWAAVWRLGRQ